MFKRKTGRRFASLQTGRVPCLVEFFRGFQCIENPKPLVAAMFMAVCIFVFVLYLNGNSIDDMVFALQGPKTVYLLLSRLNTRNDVTVPNDESWNGEGVHISKKSNLQLSWQVEGVSAYINKFPKKGLHGDGIFGQFQSGEPLNSNGTGFWFFQFGPLTEKTVPPLIKCSGLLDTNEKPEDIEVAVAISAFVNGEAAVHLEYEDPISGEIHTETLPQSVFREQPFCFKILELPFKKRIDGFLIKPISTNPVVNGIVIVDKIVVVIARPDRSETFMHTLVPNRWCSE